jgi:hypothetical protein
MLISWHSEISKLGRTQLLKACLNSFVVVSQWFLLLQADTLNIQNKFSVQQL